MAAVYEAELRRVFAAPRALTWAIVADTNRWDRAAGLAPPTYRWVREEDRLLRQATARELGIALEWIEPPYRWVEGRYVEAARRFTKGPVSAGGFRVRLSDAPGGGTEAHAVGWVEAPWAIGMMQKVKFNGALRRYFDAIEAALAAGDLDRDTAVDEPAVVRARRVLSRGYHAAASGTRGPVDEPQLASRAAALAKAPVDAAIAQRLTSWLRDRPDEEVSQLRPFELAQLWNTGRRETLQAFLHATQAGLVELSWQINCPICRVGARLIDDLGALDGKSHCGACEIDYEVDFARHVEAVFPVSPSIRQVGTGLYCASSPAFLPHVLAQLRLDPRESRSDVMTLPMGALHLRTLWARRIADLELEVTPAVLTVRVTGDTIEASASGASANGETEVRVENTTDREAVLLFERGAWASDAVLGTTIASMPEFVGLFAAEAPAAGVELRVGHLAVLFSDLTGSTAMYERVGDARAFAIVEDHFRLMEDAVAKNGGAIVKTMGDAVMAAFPSAREAVAAGLAMVAAHDAKYARDGLGVKIGVHAGPCLAVRANDRLDYFGTTVNVAARLQAQALASEVVLSADTASDPTVAPLLGALSPRSFGATLKGIAKEQQLVGYDASALASGASASARVA